jgi:hypothetical protein
MKDGKFQVREKYAKEKMKKNYILNFILINKFLKMKK